MSRAISSSRARLYQWGWIALRFAGLPGRSVPEFFRDNFGVDVSEDTVVRAVKPVRAASELKQPRGPRPQPASLSPGDDAEAPAIWTDWLRVDEQRLGVRKVLIRVPNDGFELPGVVEALATIPGIRQVIETREMREIFAVALVASEEGEEDLRAQVQEHVPGRSVSVSAIRRESDAGTAPTWLALANAAAEEER